MAQSLVLTGLGGRTLLEHLREHLLDVRPRVIGFASAFVSVWGVRNAQRLAQACGAGECRLIAGLDGEVTHPNALRRAAGFGWQVRIGRGAAGIYHPKLIVGGAAFSPEGEVLEPVFLYEGSANLGRAGFELNVECSILATRDACVPEAGRVYADLWNRADVLSEETLVDYSRRFAERNRRRTAEEIAAVALDEVERIGTATEETLRQSDDVPDEGAIGTDYAAAAWVGLESLTGDYTLQVEFPRTAADVLRRIISDQTNDDRVRLLTEDGASRDLKFAYYEHNGMFRLNIPNDVPNAQWARDHRTGIALIERGEEPGAMLRLWLLRPGDEMDAILRRSFALGTWSRTSTRLYGWF